MLRVSYKDGEKNSESLLPLAIITVGIAMSHAPAEARHSHRHNHHKVERAHHRHYQKLNRRSPKRKQFGGRLNRVVGPLASKVRQIQSACGSVVISSVRRTRVARSRHMSLHASGRAVDLKGIPVAFTHNYAAGLVTGVATAPIMDRYATFISAMADGKQALLSAIM